MSTARLFLVPVLALEFIGLLPLGIIVGVVAVVFWRVYGHH